MEQQLVLATFKKKIQIMKVLSILYKEQNKCNLKKKTLTVESALNTKH